MTEILAKLAELLASPPLRKFAQGLGDALLNLVIAYVQNLLRRRSAGPGLAAA